MFNMNVCRPRKRNIHTYFNYCALEVVFCLWTYICVCCIQILAAVDKSMHCISQTPCFLIHNGIELSLLLNCYWWGGGETPKFHSTHSVVNWNQWGWIEWLKFDRITDGQQWQQTQSRAPFYFFEPTKLLSGWSVPGIVAAYWSFWNLLWDLNFFLHVTIFSKQASCTMQVGEWETFVFLELWNVERLYVYSSEVGAWHWWRISEWMLSKTAVVIGNVFCLWVCSFLRVFC